jgi:ketosteroid isomerase-like protein
MHRTWTLAIALLLCPLAAYAQNVRPDTAGVLAALRSYDAAWNVKDTAGVRRSLAPAYRYFSSTGEVMTQAEVLGLLSAPEYRVDRAERTDIAIQRWGDAAVVSSRWKGSGVYAGGTFDDDQRCSLVFVRLGQAWRLAAEHCTQIRADP